MAEGQYIYGGHPVGETLRHRPADIVRIYISGREQSPRLNGLYQQALAQGIGCVDVTRPMLERLVGAGAVHQGIVAEVEPLRFRELSEIMPLLAAQGGSALVVVLDQVQDPQNFGSLIRSAFALGAQALVTPKDRSCDLTAVVAKAAAGATAQLPLVRVTNLRRGLEQLKEAGLWIVGTAVRGSRPLATFDFCVPTALVIGSEGAGLRRLVQESCDQLVHIPMAGDLGSLNAAVAGAICLYEIARQRACRAKNQT